MKSTFSLFLPKQLNNRVLEKVFEFKCVVPDVQSRKLVSSRKTLFRNMVLDLLYSFSTVKVQSLYLPIWTAVKANRNPLS